MMENDLFKFPKSIVNDIEGFVFYYKMKFPKVVDRYLDLVKKYYNNPGELRKICIEESDEMVRISKKFIEFYKDIEKTGDLKKLIEIDQKLNKLSCFKFWIYNYLLCEGPLQTFHIEKISEISENLAEGDTVEEIEYEKERTEKILIQTDYTDFYVENLLRSIKIRGELEKFQELKEYLSKFQDSKSLGFKKANEISKKLSEEIKKDKEKYKILWEEFKELLGVCEIQDSYLPLSSVIRMGFEYKERALKYEENHEQLKKDIESIFVKARKNLSDEDYKQLNISYKMLRLLAESKDLFGKSDDLTIPFWFKLIRKIAEKLKNQNLALGQGTSYYSFVWHVPDNIKGIIYKIDSTDFNEEELFKDSQ